jgi:flagella basal body P-ring formation protein FlgA
VLLLLCAQASNSFGAQSLSAIAGVAAVALESAAKAKGYQNIEVQIRPLDNRIQLADCGEQLTTLPSTQQHVLGAMSVGVRCNGPQPWTLYVRGNVTAQQAVPVLKHAMGRGDIIGPGDITVEQRLIGSDTGGTITDPEDLLGYAARRPLRQGDEIQFSDVVAPQIIERGQQVTILSAYGGLQVSMQGKALANGAAGDRVLVTNLSSGKRVEGVVNPRGEIVVP